MNKENFLLNINNLTISYQARKGGKFEAVKDFSLQVREGETIGLWGESGCGKTTVAMAFLQLPLAAKVERGEIIYQGINLLTCKEKEKRNYWGREIGFVFQNSGAALNPVLSVGRQLKDVLAIHGSKENWRKMLAQVDLEEGIAKAYPHQLSGGMQQRVMIALVLAAKPRLLVIDEATTGLDLITQKSILNLLKKIKEEESMTILLITHDPGVAWQMCDRIAIIEKGELQRIIVQEDFALNYSNPLRRRK